MNIEQFIKLYKDYADSNTLKDSKILFTNAEYRFIGVWDAIPTGTVCKFPRKNNMIDYIGSKTVSAFMIDYQDKERFVTFRNLEYIPDIDAAHYIIMRILKKEP